MKSSKNNLKEEMNSLVDSLESDEKLNIFKSKMKAKPNEPFVITFYKNIGNLLSGSDLTKLDMRVLFSIIQYVSFGNVINLTQQTIADDLEIDQSQVSKSFKRLEKAGVIFKEKGSLFLNPNYLVKGDLYKSKQGEAYKNTRNNLYKELGEYIKDPEELEKKVHETMAF